MYESARFSDVGRLVEFLNEREIDQSHIVKFSHFDQRWTLVFRL